MDWPVQGKDNRLQNGSEQKVVLSGTKMFSDSFLSGDF